MILTLDWLHAHNCSRPWFYNVDVKNRFCTKCCSPTPKTYGQKSDILKNSTNEKLLFGCNLQIKFCWWHLNPIKNYGPEHSPSVPLQDSTDSFKKCLDIFIQTGFWLNFVVCYINCFCLYLCTVFIVFSYLFSFNHFVMLMLVKSAM